MGGNTMHRIKNRRSRQRPAVKVTAAVAIISVLNVIPAVADVWFLGIGNDGFYGDVIGLRSALEAAPNPHDTPLHFRTYSNHGGAAIIQDIGWLAENAELGDMAYVFYSGHGGTTGTWSYDEWAGTATNSYDETIGCSLSWATDDQLAVALAAIHPEVPVVAIFDTCHAGGMTGGTDDLDSLANVYVMMSCGEEQASYGGNPYSRFTGCLIEALTCSLPADADADGIVTLDEWFSYGRDHVLGQAPEFFDAGDFGSLPIVTPEPASLALFGLVTGTLLAGSRRRRLQRLKLAAVVGGLRPGSRVPGKA